MGHQPARAVSRKAKGTRTAPTPWMERWMERQAERGGPERWYRVERRDAGAVRSLGRVGGVAAHPASLDPFLSHLLLAGVEDGELVLVDEATGGVVARRAVRRPRRRR